MRNKNEHILLDPFTQKYIFLWLLFFSLCCLIIATINLFIKDIGWEHPFFTFSMILPFIHCIIFWLFLILFSLSKYGKGESNEYIKNRYPEIWKKLHPWGDYSHNDFAVFAFTAGRYDNGSDTRLNEIKKGCSRGRMLIFWPFLLIPISWILNIIIVYFSLTN